MNVFISLFDNVRATKHSRTIPLDLFFEQIRDGEWQDLVIPIWALEGEEKDKAKKKVPCVTIAGVFSERNDEGLVEHSGFVAIDIDDVKDVEKTKNKLSKDRYVVTVFRSISGKGLCVVFKINPSKHREAFRGICEYLFTNYGIIADPTSINPSRLRFVSYDPDIYIANGPVEKFTMYPKDKEPKRVEKIAYTKSDFDEIISQINAGRINLCENYHEWVRIGFALAHQFGEGGREYFHLISSMSAKYDSAICDKQYTACVKHKSSSRESTIATLYYYCKLAGIRTYSERTRKITQAAYNGKKAGISAETVAENLRKFEQIEGDDVIQIVKQVQENNIQVEDANLLDQVEMFLRQNYDLKRNEITRYIENYGVALKQEDLNTIFITAKKIFDALSYDMLERLINSNFIPTYNPLHEFFNAHKDIISTGHIERLLSSIKTKDPAFLQHFGKKWLVSIIAAAYWEHSMLMLVLAGERQGTGKTEWFRRLLPKELKVYYAESKLDAGKDDYILMCMKLICMDDEMGGKSKKESKLLKELSSKDTFSLRAPYGRTNIDMRRLAVLCGTTNDDQILNDPTGNRRIIPIPVFDIDHDIYNSVDKTALIMECWHLYQSGFNWRLTREEIEWLAMAGAGFKEACKESELFNKFFAPFSGTGVALELTVSEVAAEIELETKQKLNIYRLGAEMKAAGCEQKFKKVNKTVNRVYLLERTNRSLGYPTNDAPGFKPWTPPAPETPNEGELLF